MSASLPSPAQSLTPRPPLHPTLIPPPSTSASSLLSLPPEIHLLISAHLNYPDALSLKHSHPHFYDLVDTGVRLKVDWLIERHRLRLDFPNEGQCVLRTDAAFCSGQVSRLMERRRRHEECASGRCVVGGIGGCRRKERGAVAVKIMEGKGWRRRAEELWRLKGLWGWWHGLVVVWAVVIWTVGRAEGWW
ncbi:MAG: hypothetical protein M1837_002188 [Sclerophora amabilis]|nr:MAG: hypothetical protein M1837_002188 [Sclerophora amabilis]